MTGIKKPWFDSGGVPIHYIVTGKEDGEPVLLIHGFASSIEALWPPVIAALQKDYKVVAMDIRGCGGSGKPHDPSKYWRRRPAQIRRGPPQAALARDQGHRHRQFPSS